MSDRYEFARTPEAVEGIASFRKKRKPSWYPGWKQSVADSWFFPTDLANRYSPGIDDVGDPSASQTGATR
jgi:hypothetical protein